MDVRAAQHTIDVCYNAGVESRQPLRLADVLDALADIAPVSEDHRYKLRTLAQILVDVVLLDPDEGDVWSRFDLADAIDGVGDERRVDLEQIAFIWGSLGDVVPHRVSIEDWTTIEKLLRSGRIVTEDEPEPEPVSLVEDVRPRCNAPALPKGWHYVERGFGVVLRRDDKRGLVEPVDVAGSRFKGFTLGRGRPSGGKFQGCVLDGHRYEPLRTPKGAIAKFSRRHDAMRQVSWRCQE